MDLAFLPPTSNICERLFSASRLILTDYRKSMSPRVFESIMALKMNRDLWDAKLVEKALSGKPKSPKSPVISIQSDASDADL